MLLLKLFDYWLKYNSNQAKAEAKKREQKKYTVKPPKDLRSKFEQKQAARRQKEQEEEDAKKRKEEEDRQAVS